jgi:hypothetical protein
MGGLALLAAFAEWRFDTYYRLAQEDGFVEWLTVTVLVPAIWLCLAGARRWWRGRGRVPWFYVGLGAFCIFFAGEEISWGQRLLGYVPPPYFLEHNTQQEANIHNLFKHILRTKYVLMMILGLWGVLLPLLHRFVAPAGRLLARLGVIVPPWQLVPSFLTILILLVAYPWRHFGEIAECAFAIVLYFTLVLRVRELPPRGRPALVSMSAGVLVSAVAAWLIPVGVEAAAAGAGDPLVHQARREAAWLREDWHRQANASRRPPSRRGTHIRIFTWVRKYDYKRFRDGRFSRGGDDDRYRFYVDPWGSPYWVRHVGRGREELVFIYSFGPNRRRDSTARGLQGDDVGVAWRP